MRPIPVESCSTTLHARRAALPSPGSWADEPFACLTTTGRRTSRPHLIEIWFAAEKDRVYLLSGNRERADWVRNLQVHPWITFELAGKSLPGIARVIEAGTPEDQRARELVVAKYREGNDLDWWSRAALPILVTFPAAEAAYMVD